MITNRHLPTEYAELFNLSPKADDESLSDFRERVARELAGLGKMVYAHEALMNDRMSDDLFAYGSLDRGFGDGHIKRVARIIEESYQNANRPKKEGVIRSFLSKLSIK